MYGSFNAGDAVRILPYEDIASRFVFDDQLPSGCRFPIDMKKYCGHEYVIKRIAYTDRGDGSSRYYLHGIGFYVFTAEMFDPSFEDKELNVELKMPFEDLMNGS